MPYRLRAAALGLALASPQAAGCAGWDGESVYRAPKVPIKRARVEPSYRVGLPGSDWSPILENLGSQVQVAWRHPELVGVIQVHGQCREQGDSSLAQYTDHMRIDWTAWKIIEQEETRLVDRAALRTLVDAELDGMTRRSEMWVVKKNGCLFDLVYSSRPGDFKSGQNDFRRVVDGFQFPM